MSEQKNSILYIDDEISNLETFQAAFRRSYHVLTANSAEEAIKIMRSTRIGVVLTDQRMPDVSGVDFLTTIIHEFPDTVRIVVSGYTDAKDLVKSINDAYIFRYITKPWNQEDLKNTIDLALRIYDIQKNRDLLIKKMQDEHNRQARILNLFHKYVPMYLLEDIEETKLNQEDAENLFDGELMEISVFFVRIRNLSNILKGKPPQDILDFLNAYLALVTKSVEEYHGTIDKFIGGDIMALFGAPTFSIHNAKNAVFCALSILDHLEEFNKKLKDKINNQVEIDVSICFGEAIVGNLGSPDCLSYTAIGDTVNTAARVLELTKVLPSSRPLIINEPVFQQVNDNVYATFLGKHQIRGKENAIDIYQVVNKKM
jgi:adenylate cyclase